MTTKARLVLLSAVAVLLSAAPPADAATRALETPFLPSSLSRGPRAAGVACTCPSAGAQVAGARSVLRAGRGGRNAYK